ncbi:MAG: hypothetical protein IID46_13100 [Planctomycetes bacterium]|nr:hypothetical protein [Planctomycetota bacterium]
MSINKNSHSGKFRDVLLRLAGLALVMLSVAGCLKEALFIGLLVGGPPSVEPEFDRWTKSSMTDKGVTVAVVCYAPKEILLNNFKVDQSLSKYVANRLHQHRIKVINPDRIDAWMDQNPNWERALEIGEAFGVTYVINVDLEDYSLYERDSPNLYRGRSQVHVQVWEMDDDGEGEKVFERSLNSVYPLAIPRSTSQESLSTFRRKYLSRLSEEIGRLFYEHYNGDDIPDAT